MKIRIVTISNHAPTVRNFDQEVKHENTFTRISKDIVIMIIRATNLFHGELYRGDILLLPVQKRPYQKT
ncbi:hypothetical protein GCM10027516_12520 [Niabella aquatica]